MKLFVPLSLLAGLLVAGCASDNNSNFSAVPGPSGGATVAIPNESQTQTAPAQSQMSRPSASEQSQAQPSHAIVTPDTSTAGKVVTYNSVGRFVVLRIANGQIPKVGQTFFAYRGGLKVGELKISGEQRDDFIVADVVSGEAQAGDEVRDQ